jgi:hypothetical protein
MVAYSLVIYSFLGICFLFQGGLSITEAASVPEPQYSPIPFSSFNNGWPSHPFAEYLFYTATMAPKNQVVLNNSFKATSLDMNGQSIRVLRLFSSQIASTVAMLILFNFCFQGDYRANLAA